MHILLIGAGNMSAEYVRVLDALKVDYTIVGRGKKSADLFKKNFNKNVLTGGLESTFNKLQIKPTHAIIASSLESLEENTLFLLEKKIKNILVEKPAAVDKGGMERIFTYAKNNNANVFIAYNRRFYSSVMEAEKLIQEEGGLSSFSFEFTEWSHIISQLNKTPFQIDNWFIGNSSHVIDLAFFFGGKPKELSSYVRSNLDWHPKGSVFTGAGSTNKDILFSYQANWQAPGSWKLELLTKKNRYIFRPLEKLQVQKLGSMNIEVVKINEKLDIEFKPGLYKQTHAFLYNDVLSHRLLNVNEGIEMMKVYKKMLGGQNENLDCR